MPASAGYVCSPIQEATEPDAWSPSPSPAAKAAANAFPPTAAMPRSPPPRLNLDAAPAGPPPPPTVDVAVARQAGLRDHPPASPRRPGDAETATPALAAAAGLPPNTDVALTQGDTEGCGQARDALQSRTSDPDAGDKTGGALGARVGVTGASNEAGRAAGCSGADAYADSVSQASPPPHPQGACVLAAVSPLASPVLTMRALSWQGDESMRGGDSAPLPSGEREEPGCRAAAGPPEVGITPAGGSRPPLHGEAAAVAVPCAGGQDEAPERVSELQQALVSTQAALRSVGLPRRIASRD